MATFTEYDPQAHSLASLVEALLADNSGLIVDPPSISLVSGSGLDPSIFDEGGVPPEGELPLATSLSFYDGSIAGLGIGAGLLLTSGDGAPPETNSSEGYSLSFESSTTDEQLGDAVKAGFEGAGDVQDVTLLEFTFQVADPSMRGVQLEVVFASDEYPEYVDSSFVDIGAVFVNGQNYALFSGQPNRPLSIIAPNIAAGGFADNADGHVQIEYDGISTRLIVAAPVHAGSNVIKIAVGDTGDSILDSGIFVANMKAVPFVGSGIATPIDDASDGVIDHVLVGTSFDDILYFDDAGGVGTGGAGNDTFDGGSGFDTAVYSGSLTHFQLMKTANGYAVSDKGGTEGIDALIDIERVKFADFTVNLTVQEQAAGLSMPALHRLEELYVAFFNRIPDADGLQYWVEQFKAGATINQIAESFYSAGVQYSNLTGFSTSMTNADFVNVVYKNVLGRADGADPEGLAYWTGALDSGGASRGSLVSTILDSAHTFKGDLTWGWVADLLDNKIAVASKFAVEWGLNYNTPEQSIANGMAVAAAITPDSVDAAIGLIGVTDADIDLA